MHELVLKLYDSLAMIALVQQNCLKTLALILMSLHQQHVPKALVLSMHLLNSVSYGNSVPLLVLGEVALLEFCP